jgi:proline iminopeptidase
MRFLAPVLLGVAVGCGTIAPTTQTAALPRREGYFAGADGVRLYFLAAGTAPDTIVFVHGGPGGHIGQMQRDLVPLSERHTVIYYDQRGGGRSELPADTTALTLSHHVRDLEALRAHFGLARMTLMAHSFGPAIAANYAIAHPDRVARMVLIAPIPPRMGTFPRAYIANLNARRDDHERAVLDSLERLIVSGTDVVAACREVARLALPHRVGSPELASRVRQDPCDASSEALQYAERYTSPVGFASLGTWDWRAGLATVSAPTLILYGEKDLIPAEMEREWGTALPNARVVAVPGAGHYMYVEQPELFSALVEGFLNEGPTGGR